MTLTVQHEDITVALWALDLSYPVDSLEDWMLLVEDHIRQAEAAGARVFVMPEYAADHWRQFEPKGLSDHDELIWLADHAESVVELFKALAKTHDMLIVPGTFPVHSGEVNPPFNNRAHIIFPDGRVLTQDKLCLTPWEKNPDGWHLSEGNTVTVFKWAGYRMAVLICLDIELPDLAARMSEQNCDLVLVPSMTYRRAGYRRVTSCAQARAIELQSAVAVVGAIGAPLPEEIKNIAGVSVFLPCEEQFGHTGVLLETTPVTDTNGPGQMHTINLPLHDIRDLRQNGPEVWPGGWDASHLEFIYEG